MPRRRPRRSRLAPTARPLRCEALEDRRVLTTYVVDSLDDAGPGTLREAVALANASTDVPDEIAFAANLSGATIHLTSGQLEITDPLSVDASSLEDGLTIDANQASRHFYVSQTRLDLARLTLTGGYGEEGVEGGSVWSNGELHVAATTFSHNGAGVGGAIYNDDGLLYVESSLFYRNVARLGGAINVTGQTTTQIDDSTFSENVARTRGGAIYATGSFITQLDVNNSTLIGNLRSDAEDPFNDPDPTPYYDAIYEYNAPFSPPRAGLLRNSVVDGLVDGMTAQNTFFVGEARHSRAYYDVDTRFGVAPLLTPLMDNGGPTLTYAPLAGSPLIDAGAPALVSDPAGNDQRGEGFRRVVDGGSGVARVDVGAYEAQAALAGPAGDFNDDSVVNAADYTTWRDNLGATQVAPHTMGDVDGDGDVDRRDLDVLHASYGLFHATRLVVNDLSDDDDQDIANNRTTLREAIRYASERPELDTITFAPALDGGVIDHGGYYVEGDLTLDASSLSRGLTIDGQLDFGGELLPGRSTLFQIGSSTHTPEVDYDFTLKGITLLGAGGPAAIDAISWGAVTLVDTEIRNSRNSAVSSWGPVTLIDSHVSGATSNTYFGHGAVQSQSSVTLLRSEIVDVQNGGIQLGRRLPFVLPLPDETLTVAPFVSLTDSTVTGVSSVGGIGGAYAISAAGDVSLVRSHVDHNTTGGVFAANSGTFIDGEEFRDGHVSLIDSTVSGNSIEYIRIPLFGSMGGGAGIIAGGDVSLTRSRVEDNTVLQNLDNAYGGGVGAVGVVTLVDSHVNGNTAGFGGGVYALGFTETGAPPTPDTTVVSLLGSSVSNNVGEYASSAIHSRGSIRIEGSSVSGNAISRTEDQWAEGLSTIYVDEYSNDSRIEVVDSVLAGNTGGGFTYVIDGGNGQTVDLVRSHVIDNQSNGVRVASVVDSTISRNAGVGVEGRRNTELLISGSTISGNHTGVYAPGNVRLVDSVVRGNRGNQGGGDFLDRFSIGGGVISEGSVFLERSLVAENVLDSRLEGGLPLFLGAGISTTRTVFAYDSTIRDNHHIGDPSSGGGTLRAGGIGAKDVLLYGSTVSGNHTEGASAAGGGVAVRGITHLWQSTISGNQAVGDGAHGGGLDSPRVSAFHSTLVGNQAIGADSHSGGVDAFADLLLDGVILAGNTAATSPDLSTSDTAPQVRYTLIGDPSDLPAAATEGDGNLLGVDPLLGPLADNGGPTWTHALLAGSPAINAGDPLRTGVPHQGPIGLLEGLEDQRGAGFPRVTDGGDPGLYRIDIGSFELAGETAPVDPPVDPPAGQLNFAFLPQTQTSIHDAAFAQVGAPRADTFDAASQRRLLLLAATPRATEDAPPTPSEDRANDDVPAERRTTPALRAAFGEF